MAMNLGLFIIVLILPLFLICLELDPFCFIFEIFLPSKYQRNLYIIIVFPFVRLFLGFLCVFEFCRFVALILFISLCLAFTLVNCFRELVKVSKRNTFNFCILKMYIQLQIIMKTMDYFIRHVLVLLLFCAQVLIVTMSWVVFKCWNQIPFIVSFAFGLAAIFSSVGVAVLLPLAVELCETSRIFVGQCKAENHTFDRHSRRYHQYLKWKSQHILPVRFGVRFTLSKASFLNYFEVLITNLTTSILLVNP